MVEKGGQTDIIYLYANIVKPIITSGWANSEDLLGTSLPQNIKDDTSEDSYHLIDLQSPPSRFNNFSWT